MTSTPIRIFISSVQSEFEKERSALRDYVHDDVLVRRFFDNPLLAESLYLAEYIEQMGTGTLDMIGRCIDAGLREPQFVVSDGFVTTVGERR